MTALLTTVLVASVLGSVHCVGMCGGLVAFYSGSDSSTGWRKGVAHGVYNGGRALSYVILGALAGAFGSLVNLAGNEAGLPRLAALIGGTMMIVWGLIALAQALGVPLSRLPQPKALQKIIFQLSGKLRGKPPVFRALFLGVFSAILPCGWLYAFALIAAGTGSPITGALVMFAFWLGTVPWLLGLGVIVQSLAAPLRRRIPAATAIILVVVGVMAVTQRAEVPFAKASAMATMKAAVLQGDESADMPHEGHASCHE
ncbi:MAG: sulfite exporter TauE/SafE family protein [Deltaproteobacteria bacterium]|nr:sulfite exporter TauE/SafE family protein [Deltaproteobacteria bacterium]